MLSSLCPPLTVGAAAEGQCSRHSAAAAWPPAPGTESKARRVGAAAAPVEETADHLQGHGTCTEQE